jgi:hypothetical protein
VGVSLPEPGWYADPGADPTAFRWWDGTRWTGWSSRDAHAAPPLLDVAAPVEVAPAPLQPEPAEPGVRLPLAVALVVGALVLATAAVGAVVSASAQRLPSGPALPPPTPSAVRPVVQYDPVSRTASVAALRWVPPVAPYACAADAQPRRPAFDELLLCAAPVHDDYAGADDWSASTGLGVVGPTLSVPGDPKATADKVFGALRGQFFAGQRTEVRQLVAQRFDGAPDGTATAVSGEVHYEVEGLPSEYDRLVVLVVELADGGYATWFSSRPDDTPASTLTVLDASIATLTAK